MSEKEWPTLGFSVKGNRYEIKATRGEIYEAYTDDQIIELVDRRAIAAKDARIAELDEVLSDIVKLLAVDKKGAYTSPPVRKILDWSARAELAIASQPSPAPLAAIPSEDGREVPEVVANFDGLYLTPLVMMEKGSELMTVAQHSRIVAAKDAEIAELRGLTPELPPRPPEGDGLPRYGLRWNGPAQPLATPFDDGYWTPWHLAQAEIQRLSAQPARQVGGDEWTTALEQALDKECGRSGNAVPVGVPIYSISLPEIIAAVRSTALSPAAVVMPERESVRDAIAQALGDAYDCIRVWPAWEVGTMGPDDFVPVADQEDRLAELVDAAFSEFARLNRRAIPAGQWEQVKYIAGIDPIKTREILAAVSELRALLGKS